MSALTAQQINVQHAPELTIVTRTRVQPRTSVAAKVAARTVSFIAIASTFFVASTVAGFVGMESSRNQANQSLIRARDAEKRLATLTADVAQMGAPGTLRSWIHDHGFVGSDTAK